MRRVSPSWTTASLWSVIGHTHQTRAEGSEGHSVESFGEDVRQLISRWDVFGQEYLASDSVAEEVSIT